jgi:hypothetical protein
MVCTTGITPWQSALKFRLLTVAIRDTNIFFLAIRGMIIFFVAIRGQIFFLAILNTHLSADCHNRVKSSACHFLSTVPLFALFPLF